MGSTAEVDLSSALIMTGTILTAATDGRRVFRERLSGLARRPFAMRPRAEVPVAWAPREARPVSVPTPELPLAA